MSTPQHFSKRRRLNRRKDYLSLRQNSSFFRGQFLLINYRLDPSSTFDPRLGMTVSRRYGKAVQRNAFRRLVREIFRKHIDKFPPGIKIHIRPRKENEGLNYQALVKDLETFYGSLK